MVDKSIKACPYCGSEEYYIKQSFKGTCNYVLRFDGKEAENGDCHANAQYRDTSKYAWCNDCGRRLFKIDN